MNKLSLILSLCVMTVSIVASAQNTEPWKPAQLLSPASLSAVINNSSAEKPLIIDIGPAGSIKGSVKIGAVNKKENLKKLKELLLKENKDREIVIYCGCCPYEKCPNIRPAFSLLNSLKFTNHKLLDLPKNLKVDWIDHGYPMTN
jgi:thiosulfate/3-mercaptopyruvate sulfurtransferase